MRLRTVFWGVAMVAIGIALAAGWIPGPSGGMRSALAGVLITLGALSLMIPTVTWTVLKTTRPEDYEGTCPVGRVCPACEAFTFYPRSDCKSCGLNLAQTAIFDRRESEPL